MEKMEPSLGWDDVREALFNERLVGPATQIQLPAERITRLHGIILDLDPKLYAADNPLFPPSDDPALFFANIRPVVDRHPLARFAEVRMSGTGLHLILHLEPAVELKSAGDQNYWAAVVRVVQCSLPIDPDMPGITATTRPVGATNSKNGATVRVLKAGEPVAPKAVEAFLARVAEAPFKEVVLPLLGSDRVSPCPVCGGEGTRLDVLSHVGKCYGGCSKVTLEQLYDRIFLAVPQAAKQPVKKRKTSAVMLASSVAEVQIGVRD